MADPVVHITNGVPDSGTGNITTLGQTLTDGANATLGANADAASATGSISAKLRALVTAIGTTAWDLGSGTSGTRTQRVIVDTSQLAANKTTAGVLADGYQQVDVPTDGTQATRLGGLTETAPASDTASSGLNGRLQRVAQRITSMIALLPTALGAGGGLKVDGSGTALPVSGTVSAGLVPVTSGGLTISSTLIASGTNATSVKASAGQLYKIEVTNNSANIGYLKIYNTAGTPTAGSGTPVIRLMCPSSASGTGAFSTYDNGVALATGIGFTFTGGIADADTTSVAASAFIVNLYYK